VIAGCYAVIGSARPDWSVVPSLQSPRFDVDESCLVVGAEFLVQAALRLLKGA
jgi:metal-dependent amidase/aminoacylase/carboxypeptidase family protein